MERYATKIDDGTLYVESVDGWIEVGTLADIVEIVGGETYTIEYEEKKAIAYDWLDSDGALSFDVRETLEEMTYPLEFVETLDSKPLDREDGEVPERTTYFAELKVDIWDSKGTLADREENPFA